MKPVIVAARLGPSCAHRILAVRVLYKGRVLRNQVSSPQATGQPDPCTMTENRTRKVENVATARIDEMGRPTMGVMLDEAAVDPDPIRQFAAWYEEGSALDTVDPNAMALATATADGAPSARMVLLKSFDKRGFVFFTSYESRKGRELEGNPRAALIMYWNTLRRQIRIEGTVERVDDAEVDAYFATRPRGSQIAARASHQSTVIPDRRALEAGVERIAAEFQAADVPRPAFWGGYRVVPRSIEFWQGRPDRLHDRIRYRCTSDGTWLIERLSP
jgi:pyridoxamine 5'-phosphate oxidase